MTQTPWPYKTCHGRTIPEIPRTGRFGPGMSVCVYQLVIEKPERKGPRLGGF